MIWTRPKGVLSGVEIADAVKRQKRYRQLLEYPHNPGLKLSLIEELELWWLRRQPRIHIDDFDPTPSDKGGSCGPNSYDLHLAPELLTYDVPVMPDNLRNYVPHVSTMPQVGVNWDPFTLDMKKDNPTRKMVIPPEGYILKPGRLYLGRTREHTESYNVVPYIDGRSSIGRLGCCVHLTAGAGDAGYRGTFTLEITVVHPLRVFSDVKIAQIKYVPLSLRHREYRGRYQNTTGVVASRFHRDAGVTV